MIDRSLFIENFIDGSGNTSGRKAQILIVDDSAIVLRNIKVLLDQTYAVSVAPSGKHALLSIKDRKPDLILLDYLRSNMRLILVIILLDLLRKILKLLRFN